MADLTPVRIKDIELMATELLADDYFVVDGPTGGVRRIAKDTVLAASTPGAGILTALPGVSVRRTTDYVSEEDNDVIAFDTVEFDSTGSSLWNVAQATRIGPVPAAWNGLRIEIHAEAIWASGVTSAYRELKVFRNGDTAEPVAVVQLPPAANNTGLELVSRPLVVATGDYFELCARVGGTETVLSADDYSITFGMTLLASVAGPQGEQGEQGDGPGWSPVLAVVADGERRVLQVANWVGGTGTPPAAGSYLGPAGFVAAIGDGVNIRGATGATGGSGGTSVGQAFAYPTTFDGSDTIDGSSTTPFVDVDAFTTKDVLNSRVLRLITVGSSQDDRVRVTFGTTRAGVFDIRMCFQSMFCQYNAADDTYVEIRLSQADDTQIALFRLYGRYLNNTAQCRLGSKFGTSTPPSAGVEFDPLIPVGLPITLRIKRDGSNSVTADFGLGQLPIGLVPISDGDVGPKTAVVTGTLARLEISHHIPASVGATTQVTSFVDYVANL